MSKSSWRASWSVSACPTRCVWRCWTALTTQYLIDRSSRKKLFFDSQGQPRPVVNSKGRRRRPSSKTLAQMVKSDDAEFLDFLAKCLIYDPDRRIKAQAALRHPFIRGHRNVAAAPGTPASSFASPSATYTNISTPRRRLATTGSASMANTAPAARVRPIGVKI